MGAAEADGESSEQAEPANGEGAEGGVAGDRAGSRSDGDVDEEQDEGRRESTGSRRRRSRADPEPDEVRRGGLRSLSRRAWAAIAAVAVVLAGATSFVADFTDVFDRMKGPPSLIEAASEAISECSRPGYVCEQALGDPIRFAPGAGQLIAIGVNLYKLEDAAPNAEQIYILARQVGGEITGEQARAEMLAAIRSGTCDDSGMRARQRPTQ